MQLDIMQALISRQSGTARQMACEGSKPWSNHPFSVQVRAIRKRLGCGCNFPSRVELNHPGAGTRAVSNSVSTGAKPPPGVRKLVVWPW
jgi:hypothetical protein